MTMRKIKQQNRPFNITYTGLIGRVLYDSATTIENARATAAARHKKHPKETVQIWKGGVLVSTLEARA